MNFESEFLSIEREGSIGTLWLDRPEKRNALNPALWRALPAALSALGEDGDLRAIVFAARGQSFCAGIDLASLQAGPNAAGGDDARVPSSSAPNGSVPNGSAPSGSAPNGSVPSGSAPSGSAPSVSRSACAVTL